MLLARWVYTVRMQSAYRAHMLTHPTNAQRVASAWNEWPAHEARMMRACSAHAERAQRSGHMTVPIKSDGVSCLPSYRSREDTRHTRVIQHVNQQRKCDVSESEEEDSCCWRSRRQRSRRQRQKQRATHPGPCFNSFLQLCCIAYLSV